MIWPNLKIPRLSSLTPVFILALFVSSTSAARVNVTVDDAEVDDGVSRITYSDPTAWKQGNGCTTCAAHPSSSDMLDGTWHDTSFPTNGTQADLRNATLLFNGSAIYVYCIISHSLDNPFGNSDMTFYIDDEVVGNYTLYPSGDPTYDYNVPVYTNTSIKPGAHSFKLQGGSVGGAWSIVLLDYIVYTQDSVDVAQPSSSLSAKSSGSPLMSRSNVPVTPTSSSTPIPSSSSSATGAQSNGSKNATSSNKRTVIIAVTVSCCVVLAGVVLVGLFFWSRRRAAGTYDQHEPDTTDRDVSSYMANPLMSENSLLGPQAPLSGTRERLPVLASLGGGQQHTNPTSPFGIEPFIDNRAQGQANLDSEGPPLAAAPANTLGTASSSPDMSPLASASTIGSSDTFATTGSRSPLIIQNIPVGQSGTQRSQKRRISGAQPPAGPRRQSTSGTLAAAAPMSEIGEDPPPAYEADEGPRVL